MTAELFKSKPIRVSVELDPEIAMHLEKLKTEWGLKSRGDVIYPLLKELFK